VRCPALPTVNVSKMSPSRIAFSRIAEIYHAPN
jgi:hypothetical protein